MQTFLPYRDFVKSAKVLDNKRLGKQRVEVLQILKALTGESKGWQNHPATKMWKGYEYQLCEYGRAITCEWLYRGFKDTCYGKIIRIQDSLDPDCSRDNPPWLGSELHKTHQSKLLHKLPEHYGKYFPGVPNDLEYYWPV